MSISSFEKGHAMLSNTNEKGASLIEVLGVLAVVATISVGLFSGIAHVNQKIKLSRAHAEVTDIIKAMRTQFSSFVPNTLTPEGLYEIGILKNIDEEGKSYNVFGTELEIRLSNFDDYQTFQVWYNNIPSNVCIDLLMADWGNDPSSGLRTIFVAPGGPQYKGFYWEKDMPNCESASSHCFPPTLEAVIEECTRADHVYVTWEYYI